jgi:hypothetical protein
VSWIRLDEERIAARVIRRALELMKASSSYMEISPDVKGFDGRIYRVFSV